VITVEDENFKVLVLVVVAFLVVSLTINAYLTTDPRSLSGPPIRISGYLTDQGEPIPGYYIAGQSPQNDPDEGENQPGK
jgi:hypothetical protein